MQGCSGWSIGHNTNLTRAREAQTTTTAMNETPIKFEYTNEGELLAEFKECMSDAANVEEAADYLYNSLLDEAIIGSVYEVHYYNKTGLDAALEGEPEDPQLYGNFVRGSKMSSILIGFFFWFILLFQVRASRSARHGRIRNC